MFSLRNEGSHRFEPIITLARDCGDFLLEINLVIEELFLFRGILVLFNKTVEMAIEQTINLILNHFYLIS
ncbi:MAG: hypothetical protein A3A33_00585 [Candidatus Yanofskybacteria bacterium RIFCSPLOWO2_01_FULL_49_25]|uniref:Uncharacterized protein n=1 Tax=Candidatus Yanofskybacteria bacterium RIFCSPLOWO2_01_FULL_49_25 TaxID=1802701 RepID=A0A1F8GUZ2_9BACT|nr:MAG: hypothetical protein A3A33_00585 [Candidatus Yanofskybacteria bacterium RIFCSPLOWO2_01_FULL_49_25]